MMTETPPKIAVMEFLIDHHKTIFPEKLALKLKPSSPALSLSEMMDFAGGESPSSPEESSPPIPKKPVPTVSTTSTTSQSTSPPPILIPSPRQSIALKPPPPIPHSRSNIGTPNTIPTSQSFGVGSGIPPPPPHPSNSSSTTSSAGLLIPTSTSYSTSTSPPPIIPPKKNNLSNSSSGTFPPPPPPPPAGLTSATFSTSTSTSKTGPGHKRVTHKTLPAKVNYNG
jgi:hypothetical protein